MSSHPSRSSSASGSASAPRKGWQRPRSAGRSWVAPLPLPPTRKPRCDGCATTKAAPSRPLRGFSKLASIPSGGLSSIPFFPRSAKTSRTSSDLTFGRASDGSPGNAAGSAIGASMCCSTANAPIRPLAISRQPNLQRRSGLLGRPPERINHQHRLYPAADAKWGSGHDPGSIQGYEA